MKYLTTFFIVFLSSFLSAMNDLNINTAESHELCTLIVPLFDEHQLFYRPAIPFIQTTSGECLYTCWNSTKASCLTTIPGPIILCDGKSQEYLYVFGPYKNIIIPVD